jgi:hypothetical protein
MAKEQGRPFVSLVMGLILVAGGVAIIINAGEHTIGVIGGGVTIVVGLLFFVRSATSRLNTLNTLEILKACHRRNSAAVLVSRSGGHQDGRFSL